MRILICFLIAIAAPFPALAQCGPSDPAFLQQALTAVEQQRNEALTKEAIAEAQLALANARVKELEDKYEPKKTGQPAKQ